MISNDYSDGRVSLANSHRSGHAGSDGERHPSSQANASLEVIDSVGFGTSMQIPIAICGMGMRLPGGIKDDTALFDFLVNKGDARSTVPSDRYNADAYYSPRPKPGTTITRHGYFLKDVNFSNFDPTMFNMTPAEVEHVDPSQRLVLEVVREAFESAGEASWRGKKIGTYVGVFSEDWLDLHSKDTNDHEPYQLIGTADFVVSNRVAYEYDLKGPSMTIKTACSSTGIGLHEALQAIRQGEISGAIVAGVNLIMAPGMTIGMSLQETLSPEGSSKSFDASADGYARGEGVSAIYVKRLDEALRDGNPIRAIIRASASNADGKTSGSIAMPNSHAHEAVIRQAYKNAGLDISQTTMVEAHGTGTPVGDPLEVKAIANVFGQNQTYLGAVKPNLGHSEGNAANTSIIKAVLSLENRTIIPNIKFNTPNPAIPWNTSKLIVPKEAIPWPRYRTERISVNSYGIGGSNVHFIIDSAASFGLAVPRSIPRSLSLPPSPPLSDNGHSKLRKSLLLFSANHPKALSQIVENHESYLQSRPNRLIDLAYTLAARREHLKHRTFCVTDSSAPLKAAPVVKYQGPSEVAFVFTGQGAQWNQMGAQLIREYTSFRTTIKYLDRVLRNLPHPPNWLIEDILLHEEDKTVIGKAEYSQPLCTAVQIALVDLLDDFGISPSAVVGHSSGEIAAAYTADALSKDEAITVAYYRGYVCRTPQKRGGMAAIGMSREDVSPYLQEGVKIACENSGSSVTISGEAEVLETIIVNIKNANPDTLARKLQVEMAYHSDHMRLVGEEYHDLIQKHLAPCQPRIPFYSSVSAKLLDNATDFGARYWQMNLENPVLFHSAVKNLLVGSEKCSVHLEVGPHSALAGPLRQIYKSGSHSIQYVSALSRNRDDNEALLEAIGQMHSVGVKVTWPAISGTETVVTDAPHYPWLYEKEFWHETRIQKNWRFRKHLPHDLLGLRILEGSDLAPVWRNNLRVTEVQWLRHHCVYNDIIFPAAGYICMAGEAMFQISDVRDYTVRDVTFSQAMVLQNDRPTEVVTTLRPQRLTSTLDSVWYEWDIVSHDGVTWNKHCSGLVRSGKASSGPKPKIEPQLRKVASDRWYATLSKVGLNYGPRFAALENITASVTEKKATADVSDVQDIGESVYMLHPSTLDMILQSWTVAAAKGEYRLFDQCFLPTFMDELYVGNGAGQKFHINTTALGRSGTVQGQSYGVNQTGELIFYLRGFKGTPLQDAESPPPLTSLQLQWQPHYEFLNTGGLMKTQHDTREQLIVLERLFAYCVFEAQAALKGIDSTQPHFEKLRTWIDKQCEVFKQPEHLFVPESRDIVAMSKDGRQKTILDLVEKSQELGCGAFGTAIQRTHDRLVDIFEGKIDHLDLLLQDGVLTSIYDWMNQFWDLKDFFRILGHTQPQMRVLEIGAGTGGLTAKILEQLKSQYGERMYLSYTFTDISAGFFVQAKERFKEYGAMEFKVLDVSKDPFEQGFNGGEYDLIIASNVLHATPFLNETLTNVRKLLHPNGQLFLQELSPAVRSMGFIMGPFSGWWLGAEDGRPDVPFVTPEEWNARLLACGFTGCHSVTFDNVYPYQMNANIIAKPSVERTYTKKVTLLSDVNEHSLATEVAKELIKANYEVEHCNWGNELPVDQDLISFVDLERILLRDISESDLEHFLSLIDNLKQASVLWLTPPASVRPDDPHAGQILGAARTIRAELDSTFATLELEHYNSGAADAVCQVLRKIQRHKDDIDTDLNPDLEFVWNNNVVNVSRFHWIPVEQSLSEDAALSDTKALKIGKRGLLQTLAWRPYQLDPLGDDDAQVRMQAVGMNFTDVLIAMGVITSVEMLGRGYNALGLEGSGYVTKIGANVKHLKIGDRVMLFGTNSPAMAEEVQRPAQFCAKIPDGMSFVDAATIPTVYMTVLVCLLQKVQLRPGQSILIHAAAGGVGIAAIHVARWLQLDIYCTVGSDEKRNFVMNELGMPEDRIFHSRDTSFYDDLMEATDGRGVDVVLNSVSGELLHYTWKCVASNGVMLEIGKRDMVGRGRLAMDKFEDNRTFIGVDLSRTTVTNKDSLGPLMQMIPDLLIKGHIKPISPVTLYDAENVEEAFRFMQKGIHIGKIVVKLPEGDTLPVTPAVPSPSFREDVSYLLVGGMGGLGKSIALWMAANGAKDLMFLSRSAGKKEEDQQLVDELKELGCSTQCFAYDVADKTAVKQAISSARKPIAGVMQMAMVLCDIGILDMDIDSWNITMRPRVQGTWNLHELLPEQMDFFVLFSSVCGLMGHYGQSNYAATNTFMDSFCQYRQNRRLTCSVLDIGAIDEVGYIAKTPEAKAAMKASAARLITEQNFLDTLQLAIARSNSKYAPTPSTGHFMEGFVNPCQVAQMLECRLPIMDPNNAIIWKRDPRMAIYRNIETMSSAQEGAGSDVLRHFLASLVSDPAKLDDRASIETLARQIGERVFAFLMRTDEEIDLSDTLVTIGVDSLVGIEVRNWWKQQLGIEVSVLELMNGGSLLQLGELAAQRLKVKFGGGA